MKNIPKAFLIIRHAAQARVGFFSLARRTWAVKAAAAVIDRRANLQPLPAASPLSGPTMGSCFLHQYQYFKAPELETVSGAWGKSGLMQRLQILRSGFWGVYLDGSKTFGTLPLILAPRICFFCKPSLKVGFCPILITFSFFKNSQLS